MFITWVTVASLAEESMYFVFIWALILYLPHISLRATAYGRSMYMHGAGVALGGTVDREMFSGFSPTFSENSELMEC